MPQGSLNIQVKKWKTHFLISSTPLHMFLSIPLVLSSYAREKALFLVINLYFLQFPLFEARHIFSPSGLSLPYEHIRIQQACKAGFIDRAHYHRCTHCFHDLGMPQVFSASWPRLSRSHRHVTVLPVIVYYRCYGGLWLTHGSISTSQLMWWNDISVMTNEQ